MGPIDAAVAAIEVQDEGEQLSYTEVADKFHVSRHTLARRCKGTQASVEAKLHTQQRLSPPQETELIKYIELLTERGLQPTKEMVRRFASGIAKEHIGKGWVTRFINRNHSKLLSRWTVGMDYTRHKADSEATYKLYFELLHSKMEEYQILPGNAYNMDEKGFMLGQIGRSKRVFARETWEKKRKTQSLQDGSREWITVLASVGADGDVLPPGLIFQGMNGNIQSTWVQDIDPDKHQVFVTSSPTGWSNNDIGLAWLKQVFDRYTKEKARRSWRLLILDGHGSHLTPEFIEYCFQNKILLFVFPPHSTHSLQPLDVVMFKSLSSGYSRALTEYTHQGQGFLRVKKGDFFLLFWDAWIISFTKARALQSFSATGIWPKNSEAVLKKFHPTASEQAEAVSNDSATLHTDWRAMRKLIKDSMKGGAEKEGRTITQLLHRLQVTNEILLQENQGLKEAVKVKQKQKKKGVSLDLQQDQEYHGGAVLWSPSKMSEAATRRRLLEQQADQDKLDKVRRLQEREDTKIQKQLELKQRRDERERLKKEKEEERAKKQAEQQRQKAEKAAITTPPKAQQSKRKASQTTHPKNKRQKQSGGGASKVGVPEAAPSPPPRITLRGRSITVPSKFR